MSGLVSFPGDVIIGDQSGDSFVVYSTTVHNAPVTFNSTVSFAAGTSITGVTLSGVTFNLASNTLTGTSAQFNVANSDDDFVFATASKAASSDVITGTDNTKYITPAALRGGFLVNGTAINTTSGTFQEFTGIPSWVKRISIILDVVSTTGTSVILFQIGPSGGVETTGYNSHAGVIQGTVTGSADYTTGFGISHDNVATSTVSGIYTLCKLAGNTWAFSGVVRQANNRIASAGGSKTLAGTLDRVRITTVTGIDTFDAGSINIIYE